MLLDRTDEWLTARMEDLDYGDIDGICQAARLFPLEGIKKDQPDTALGYFENNAPRMRYSWFRCNAHRYLPRAKTYLSW